MKSTTRRRNRLNIGLALTGLVLAAAGSEARAQSCGCAAPTAGARHNYYTYGGANGPISQGYFNPAAPPALTTAPSSTGWAPPALPVVARPTRPASVRYVQARRRAW